MGTLAANIKNLKNLKNENIVKVITKNNLNEEQFSEAETFLRNAKNINNIYHHIGIYCYSTETLERFVKLSQSQNEIKKIITRIIILKLTKNNDLGSINISFV